MPPSYSLKALEPGSTPRMDHFMTNRLFATLLALGMAVPVVATAPDASAHPAPYEHYHTHSKRRARIYTHARPRVYVAPRRAVIIREAPPVVVVRPPPRVIVRRPAPVVVQRPAPVVVTRRHARKRRAKRDKMYFGVGLRAGARLDLGSEEIMTLGGAGLTLNARFTRHWGLELSADFQAGEFENADGAPFSQLTVPVMAGVTYHFMPNSRFQPFVVAGAGVHFTSLDYLNGRYKYDLTEAVAQVGAGAELFVTRWLSLKADLRFQTVFHDIDQQARIRDDCLRSQGGMTGFCNGINTADPNDKVDLGLTFNLGANVYF